MLMYNKEVQNKPEHSTEFLSFTARSHSFNFKQIDRQMSSELISLKLSYFGKKDS